MSSDDANHSKNIETRSSLAVAVCDFSQDWDDLKSGLQLFGTCAVARGCDAHLAAKLYGRRFPAYERWIRDLDQTVEHGNSSMFFMFIPRSLKLLQEAVLGEETFVSISLLRE